MKMAQTGNTVPDKVVADDYIELACPQCGENYLHHGRIVVYSRPEDGENTTTTVVEADKLVQHIGKSELTRNPSSRRDGLSVSFWCECCDEQFEYTIAQHKGLTLLAWRKFKEEF